MFYRLILILSITLVCFSAHSQQGLVSGLDTAKFLAQNAIHIIPQPKSVTLIDSVFFNINEKTVVTSPQSSEEIQKIMQLLVERLQRVGVKKWHKFNSKSVKKAKNIVVFKQIADTLLGAEGYRLNISDKMVLMEANQPIGLFYALQTLFQVLPPQGNGAALSLPALHIEDMPRYTYRGLHLDVGRHFFPVSFIKKYIDLIALHKLNTFHWHLTEDQGWRIEIKKYPKLTQRGGTRAETLIGHGSERPLKGDGQPYSGFYTQEEIRAVVEYAKSKYVNIIPEIEMPGHSLAALSAYPELSCEPTRQYAPATRWGVFEDVFCPTEQTFNFLQDVLTEVMDLFPSKYIHIGGDECPKAAWKKSDFCQDLMRKENLKDEHELQSYFIRRIEKFLNSKGRKLMGWDEILEGGLAPDATVMSWRGTSGGITAAQQGHDVVMTPGAYCYLDHYQADPSTEPLAIGGLTSLEKVYSYEPTPDVLTPEQAKHILGAQGNVWTEYMKTPEYVEYMVFPRACALAEVLWTDKNNRSWAHFLHKLPTHLQRLKGMKVQYAERVYDVELHLSVDKQFFAVQLNQMIPLGEIRFTTDGSEPNIQSNIYTKPFEIQSNTLVKAAAFQDGRMISKVSSKNFAIHSATGMQYECVQAPTNTYESGKYGLTNGLMGVDKNFAQWTGFNGNDMTIIFDFGAERTFQNIGVNFLNKPSAWIFLPDYALLAVSEDGITWNDVDRVDFSDRSFEKTEIRQIRLHFPHVTKPKRYLKIYAKNLGKCPEGHTGAGKPAWLFADEISIE